MNELLLGAFGALLLLGAGATILEHDPYKKIISLSVLIAGTIPFIVDRGLLDVATAVALIAPLSTVFILMAVRRATP